MKKVYPLLSELTDKQKGHLAWRLEKYTYVGYFSAIRVAKGEAGNDRINEVFEKANMTKHRAKIHSNKVINFK